MSKVFFTTKVATHNSFCNREQERKALHNSIKKNQHSVVVAPRRYGKTSLIEYTLRQEGHLYARVDLFCVVYEEDICKKIAKGISKLVREMLSFSEQAVRLLEQCFKMASIAIKAGSFEINVEFEKIHDPIAHLEDLLEGIEKLAKKKNKPLVLFFDEFQDVLKADESNKIQAAIRAVAQHSNYVTYIFSGSSRMMLNKIFDDKNQPLYMLCNKIMLDRINADHFYQHIKQAAQKRWKRVLSEDIIQTILTLTESHPYYVNLLCDKLWDLPSVPTLETIKQCWDDALFENKGKIVADLTPLNTNRTKVITVIALLNVVNQPNSRLFLEKVKLPLSSTQTTIKYLLDYDYLYETPAGIALTDPLMKKFIVERFS